MRDPRLAIRLDRVESVLIQTLQALGWTLIVCYHILFYFILSCRSFVSKTRRSARVHKAGGGILNKCVAGQRDSLALG